MTNRRNIKNKSLYSFHAVVVVVVFGMECGLAPRLYTSINSTI